MHRHLHDAVASASLPVSQISRYTQQRDRTGQMCVCHTVWHAERGSSSLGGLVAWIGAVSRSNRNAVSAYWYGMDMLLKAAWMGMVRMYGCANVCLPCPDPLTSHSRMPMQASTDWRGAGVAGVRSMRITALLWEAHVAVLDVALAESILCCIASASRSE